MQSKIVIAKFVHGGTIRDETSDWILRTVREMEADTDRIYDVDIIRCTQSPLAMARNAAVEVAKRRKADFLLMIDSDMDPDLPGPNVKPFWSSSFEFMLAHNGPCVVAAPYCGAPPKEQVMVFRWEANETDNPLPDLAITPYGRAESSYRRGVTAAAALPTGLMLIDMRVFGMMKPPYFYNEYADETQSVLKCGEDVAFTRDCHFAGVPVYCNWDAWCGHWKSKLVVRPTEIPMDNVPGKFREAVENKGKYGGCNGTVAHGGKALHQPGSRQLPQLA